MIMNFFIILQLYTPYIDTAGHYQGPETEDLATAVQFADKVIMYIINQLEEKQMTNKGKHCERSIVDRKYPSAVLYKT